MGAASKRLDCFISVTLSTTVNIPQHGRALLRDHTPRNYAYRKHLRHRKKVKEAAYCCVDVWTSGELALSHHSHIDKETKMRLCIRRSDTG